MANWLPRILATLTGALAGGFLMMSMPASWTQSPLIAWFTIPAFALQFLFGMVTGIDVFTDAADMRFIGFLQIACGAAVLGSYALGASLLFAWYSTTRRRPREIQPGKSRTKLLVGIAVVILLGLGAYSAQRLLMRLDYRVVSSKPSPNGNWMAFEIDSTSEGGQAPYGQHVVLCQKNRINTPDEGYVVFAGYCEQPLTYSWPTNEILSIECSSKEKSPVRTSVVKAFGIAVETIVNSENTNACNTDLGTFLACNDRLVKGYLESLPHETIGQKVQGVTLTDGHSFLRDSTYLGRANLAHRGANIYLFASGSNEMAVVWVEKDGEPLTLPSCPESVSHESAYVLSGDVFTWRAVGAASNVVHVMCTDAGWKTQ